ncbi:MAG TPA: HBL/NHE enterotoxin family protein [Microlunatus sp.]
MANSWRQKAGTVSPLYNIGPDAIAGPGTPDGPGFALSRPEWIAIQACCTDAMALPTTSDAFRKSLGAGAPEDLSDFGPLIEAYDTLRAHVTTWTTTIYPAAVALAGDVYRYGTVEAPVYYPRIRDEVEILERDPNDEPAKAALTSLLDHLKRDAEEKSGKAGEVAIAIAQFACAAEQDLATLVGGGDDAGGLVDYYASAYGSANADVEQLSREIAEQRAIVTGADDQYDREVVVASTAPTYTWFWPLGAIAAAIVAGIYGRGVTDALDRARAAQNRIDDLADELAADTNLLVTLHHAAMGAGRMVQALTETLPVVQRVECVWGGIAADLSALEALVEDDTRSVPAIISGLAIDESVKAWHRVALRAEAYRDHAYLVEQLGRHSMATWKVATQVSSARTVSTHVMAA